MLRHTSTPFLRGLDLARASICTSSAAWAAEGSQPSSSGRAEDAGAQLSPQQAKAMSDALRQLQQGPLKLASDVATLTAMSALYRDIHLVAGSLHKRMALGVHNPLTQETRSPSDEPVRWPMGTSFPMYDTSRLSDFEPEPMKLDQRYMDKITCWAALQPNHIETSHSLLTGINLFPPQEASYPTYVDFDAVVKGLEQRKSRKRLKFWRKVSRRQDKYQMKLWDHVAGEL